jgi:hypothetical protein
LLEKGKIFEWEIAREIKEEQKHQQQKSAA